MSNTTTADRIESTKKAIAELGSFIARCKEANAKGDLAEHDGKPYDVEFWQGELEKNRALLIKLQAERIAELEGEAETARQLAVALASKPKSEPCGILDGGPVVSERLSARIGKVEDKLRDLCYLTYVVQHSLADEGHVMYRADGTACWAYGSKRMKHVSDTLDDLIKRYFGGYNYPTD